jgi:hypothetical protein
VSHGLGRDCTHCFQNHKSKLIDPLSASGDVEIYLTSYNSSYNDAIVGLYSPKSYNFFDIDNSHQVLTYIKSLEQLKGNGLDFIISTRFDIHFHKTINEIHLKHDKFNALFKENGWWNSMKFTTDNFFAFPASMIDLFINVLNGLYANPSRPGQTDLHQAFYRMQNVVGQNNTNIVSPIDELSNYNSFYSLCNEKWGVCNS